MPDQANRDRRDVYLSQPEKWVPAAPSDSSYQDVITGISRVLDATGRQSREVDALRHMLHTTREILFESISESTSRLTFVLMCLDRTRDVLIDRLLPADSDDEDVLLRFLHYSMMANVPIYPNSPKDVARLSNLCEKLVSKGVSWRQEDGTWVRHKPDFDAVSGNYDISFLIELLSTTRAPGSVEITYFKQIVTARFKALHQAEITLRRLSLAVSELETRLKAQRPPESALQQCLEKHPVLLGIEYVSIAPREKVADKYVTDFVLTRFGGDIDFVELEAPHRRLYTSKGKPSADLTHAEQQVLDWMEEYLSHPDYHRRKHPGLHKPEGIVVIGRREQMDEDSLKRLRQRNATFRGTLQVYTYDDILDKSRMLLRRLSSPSDDTPST